MLHLPRLLALCSPGCLHSFCAAGILVAQLINYGVQDWSHGWRLSLGLAAVPALIMLLGGIMLPESPNSLIERWVWAVRLGGQWGGAAADVAPWLPGLGSRGCVAWLLPAAAGSCLRLWAGLAGLHSPALPCCATCPALLRHLPCLLRLPACLLRLPAAGTLRRGATCWRGCAAPLTCTPVSAAAAAASAA